MKVKFKKDILFRRYENVIFFNYLPIKNKKMKLLPVVLSPHPYSPHREGSSVCDQMELG